MSIRFAAPAGVVALGLTVLISACAPREPTYAGTQNVDPARYNQDLAACQQKAASSFSAGNAVTDCMRARGYNVM